MKLLLLAVGKRHDSNLVAAIEDYTERLRHYCKGVQWQIVPAAEGKYTHDEQRARESAALTGVLKPDDTVILLDERGASVSNADLATEAAQLQERSGRVVLVIGGAYGVTDDFRRRAHKMWAISRLIFPHQIVRLLLVEQLYRAFTIVRGEKYHHE